MGLRGVTALEVKVTGPKMDLHSGVFGGAVANPITALAQMLATLHDRDGRVAIAGFYDRVKPLEDWEREAWRKLPVDGDKLIREETGVPELFGRPDTIQWNASGRGRLPRSTESAADIRGRDKDGDRQSRVCETDVPSRSRPEGRGNSGAGEDAFGKKSAQGCYDGSYHGPQRPVAIPTDPHSAMGEAAQRALRKAFNRDAVLIREGGSIPIVSEFREILGVETLLMGLALPDCRAHSPNENFPLENFEGGIRLNKAILQELAQS